MGRPLKKAVNTPVNADAAPVAAPALTLVTETISRDVLTAVISATAANSFAYVSPTQAKLMEDAKIASIGWKEAVDPATGDVGAVALQPEADAYLGQLAPSAAPVAATQAWTVPAAQTPSAAPVASSAVASANVGSRVSKGGYAIDRDIPVAKVTRVRTGTEPKYAFDELEIGESFHVPATVEMPDPKRTLASTVSVRNKQHSFELKDANGNVILEDQSYHQTQKDAGGAILRDAEGEPIKKLIVKTGPRLGYHKKFIVRAVDASDPRGKGARVHRVEPASADAE